MLPSTGMEGGGRDRPFNGDESEAKFDSPRSVSVVRVLGRSNMSPRQFVNV